MKSAPLSTFRTSCVDFGRRSISLSDISSRELNYRRRSGAAARRCPLSSSTPAQSSVSELQPAISGYSKGPRVRDLPAANGSKAY